MPIAYRRGTTFHVSTKNVCQCATPQIGTLTKGCRRAYKSKPGFSTEAILDLKQVQIEESAQLLVAMQDLAAQRQESG